MNEIQTALFQKKNEPYKAFMAKLLPNVALEKIIGVKVGDIRKIAQKMDEKTSQSFLSELPHTYLEEEYLHTFLLKKKNARLDEIERFLPYVNNWAVCDSFPVFDWEKESEIWMKWLDSRHPYTIRYAIVNLIKKQKFSPFWLDRLARLQSQEYYVNMAIAWYFSMALVHAYEQTLPYFEQGKIREIVYAKALQKAIESHQISAEKKQYLKELKRKKSGL